MESFEQNAKSWQLILLFFFFINGVFAQVTVIGTITDFDDDSPLPGVNVLVKGTDIGTTTDIEGKYVISVPGAASLLIFSYVGYESKTRVVGNQKQIDESLISGAELEEIVVVGYGIRRKRDLTGSVAQINDNNFEDQPLIRLEEAIQGRAAGVTVSRISGSPGGDIKVRIRGINSITGNNDPLVVIDGIIGGDLGSINPNDIASIEVLKDASATAIYGSRGSNGVILITTKSGDSGPAIEVQAFTSFSTTPKDIKTLGAPDFARIDNLSNIRQGKAALFSEQDIEDLEASGGFDYEDEIFQVGTVNNLQLSTSGKEGRIDYFISGNYADQKGIVINTGYKRISGRANVNVELSNKFNIGLNVFGSRENTLNYLDEQREFQGSLILRAITYDPTQPIRNDNGTFINFSEKSLAHLGYNPVADLTTRDHTIVEDKLNTNFNLSYQILESLDFKVITGASTINTSSERYLTTPPAPLANYFGGKIFQLQMSNILTWQKKIGVHDVKATGVYEFQKNEYRGNGYSANEFTVPGGFYFAELTNGQLIFNDYNESAIESVMLRGEYIFDDRFFITGTLRRDQSSRFRSGRNVGVFPSLAFAYNFSSLPFITYNEVFSNFKIRAGWGRVGNQNIDPYSTYPGVNANSRYAFDGTTVIPGTTPAGYGNPDLTWEKTTQTNLGLDLGIFDSRIQMSIDAYVKNTTDLLLQVPVPDFAGGGFVLSNVGEVQNRGIDFSISGAMIRTPDLRWDVGLIAGYLDNEVLSLGGRDEIQGSFENIDGSGRPLNIIQVGQPLGQFYGEVFLGTWKEAETDQAKEFGAIPGDARYLRDEDGNPVLQAIGNGTPDFTWGFNNSLSYKGFDLNFFFQGVHGFEVFNVTRGVIVGLTGIQRSFLHPEQLNQWTAMNETDIPAGGQNRIASSRYIEKGDFVRLSNLSLGYTFSDFVPAIGSLNLYLSGQNLLLISGFSGYDPEGSDRNYNSRNNDTAAGVQVGAYPNPRIVTLGVKAKF